MTRGRRTRSSLGGGVLASALLLACVADPPPSSETTGPLEPDTETTAVPSDSTTTTGVADTTTSGPPPGTTSDETTTIDDPSTGSPPVFDLPIPDMPPDPQSCPVDPPVLAGVPCNPVDVALVPPFDGFYDCLELADVPNVPTSFGGVSFAFDDPDLLLVGGAANTVAGELFAIRVTRDEDCHVTGFAEAQAQVYAGAEYNDGGVAYGPGDVLFLARWPVNELGQLLPGSLVTDRVDALAPFGVGVDSVAGLTFVPPTYPGEGQLKLITWAGGEWFTLPITAAGDGTYDPGVAVPGPILPGGPEGIVYVSGANDGFDDVSVLVSEWSAGNVATYLVDAQGDPMVGTRQDFIVGLTGAEGAHIDPTSGDFLFTTFGGGDRLIVISGFVPNPPPAG